MYNVQPSSDTSEPVMAFRLSHLSMSHTHLLPLSFLNMTSLYTKTVQMTRSVNVPALSVRIGAMFKPLGGAPVECRMTVAQMRGRGGGRVYKISFRDQICRTRDDSWRFLNTIPDTRTVICNRPYRRGEREGDGERDEDGEERAVGDQQPAADRKEGLGCADADGCSQRADDLLQPESQKVLERPLLAHGELDRGPLVGYGIEQVQDDCDGQQWASQTDGVRPV